MPDHLPDQPRLLDALASINQIGSHINRIGSADSVSIEATLRLIVESAIEVVPDTSAVIYSYDQRSQRFVPETRVSAGEISSTVLSDTPRPNGMGNRAVTTRRRILSYEMDTPVIDPVKIEAGAKAVACFPLVVAEDVVGVLYLYLHTERTFMELELLLLENFVNQAAMAIYHTRQVASIQHDLVRREEEVARLRRAGLLISSRPRLNETLDAILQMALEVTNAHYGNCRLVDKGGKDLVNVAMVGESLSRPYTKNIPIDSNSITGWVATHRQPLRIPDLRVEPWASRHVPFDHDLEMRSELAVPLIGSSGRLQGVLNLESPECNAFSEADSHLLQDLATQAVIAIQEVLLLDALKEITTLLLTEPYKLVLERLAELAIDLLSASASAIWVRGDDDLVLQAASTGHQHGERVPLYNSLAGQAVITGQAIISDDVSTDSRFHRRDLAQVHGWSQALVVPLLLSNTQAATGAFSVYSVVSTPGRFPESDWDMKVLTILADYAALAILNMTQQEALDTARAQRNVAETFAALGDISANLLHQLNNKVGTIPVRVQGVQDKSREALKADSYLADNLAEIEQSAREAMDAVRETLALLQPIQLIPVDVERCVEDALAMARLADDVQVEFNDLGALPLVLAGKQSLVLVFMNLLENAANAMNGSGVVTIEGSTRGSWVLLKVNDTGPGIATELHNRIFEFNFSVQKSSHSGKLGFGLWWVKTLLARLGGTIQVESDGQHGTAFQIKLPGVPESN